MRTGESLGFPSMEELARRGYDGSPEARARRDEERRRQEADALKSYRASCVQYSLDEQLRDERRSYRWDMFQVEDGGGADEDRRKKLALVKAWASNPEGSLLLFGGVGRGKTLLAISSARQILDDAVARDTSADISFRYGTEREVMDAFMNARKFQSRMTPEQVISYYSKPAVLVVDELGKWSANRDGLSVLEEIADERLASRRPTIWVTNLGWEDFKSRYSDGFRSRVSGHMYVINGTDHRQTARRS